jgi:TIR domain
MQLLSQIDIQRTHGNTAIQLLLGDLSNIPPEHATDILAMSAFPNEYIALEGSLIDALDDRGLSVEEIARDKEVDLRSQLNCWLSKPLSASNQQKFNFKRILCFEPGDKIKEPEEVVGDIFRCINNFAFDDDKNQVAMPIIATGYQGITMQKILPALLKAAYFWLQNGLPIKLLKLVVHRKEQAGEALPMFNNFKKNIPNSTTLQQNDIETEEQVIPENNEIEVVVDTTPAELPQTTIKQQGYDYFLSYAHVHSKDVQYFVDELKAKKRELNIFYDKDNIPPGGLWIQQISAAIQKADKVLIFLSPDYDKSPVCWDEFQCAKLMEYNLKKSIIQTIYLYGHKDTPMPLIMGIYSYIDCREGSPEKIADCIVRLLK